MIRCDRRYLRASLLGFFLLFGLPSLTPAGETPERPSILWITSEDNSPYLGCYGDTQAQTPHLDALAAKGIRYRNAFANAPVCSSARSTLITGMHASSLGIHNHRSRVRIPDHIQPYPVYLRAAGYYCSNNSKTDYNIAGQPVAAWNESSQRAHYRNRADRQPFFAVFNLTATHESQVQDKTFLARRKRGLVGTTTRIAAAEIQLPPYHPDTPAIREDWARYHDDLTLMDTQVGRLLQELDEAGLAEETIVFYYSDHGGALPRGKRNIHDSGTRVPLIIRFPARWAHLAPARHGEWIEQPVSFVDLPATLLSLARVSIPNHFEGRAFLGAQAEPAQDHVFLFRGRMDERYDTIRAIRTRQFRYVRNYSPHRPWGQHYSYPFEVLPSMRSWFDAFGAGRCNTVQARYWQPKPAEELYDLATDPYEIHNLANDPSYAALLEGLRDSLNADVTRLRDTGFIPEAMFEQLAGDRTLYDYAQSEAYPIDRIVELANHASSRDPQTLPILARALSDPHPVIRYWAAQGCLILQDQAKSAEPKLRALLQDEYADVRIAAAEALAHCGSTGSTLSALAPLLASDNEYEALAALNAIDFLHESGHVSPAQLRELLEPRSFAATPNRIASYLLAKTAPQP
jgi:arylsulfatase A-like enzyme